MNFQNELKTAVKWLFASLLMMWLLTILYFYNNQMSPWQTIQLLPNMTFQFAQTFRFWGYLFLPYLLFLWVRYLFRSLKKHGKAVFTKRLLLTTLLPAILFFAIYKIIEINNVEVDWQAEIAKRDFQVYDHFSKDKKLRGVHFAPARTPETAHFLPLVKNNIEWLALTTFAWQESPNADTIKMPPLNEFGWSKKDSSIFKTADFAKKNGIRTFLQPKILIENAKKDTLIPIQFDNDTLWENWAENYQKFILQQAHLAEEAGVELFCIGTNLTELTTAHPNFFNHLIDTVRTIYKGKLTYAADWRKEFLDVPFWKKLDYIGIQAGFSLTDIEKPSITELKEGWQPHLKKINALQNQINLPIIFTEIGYNSTTKAAFEPREKAGGFAGMFQEVSIETQQNCYLAFFETFWKEDWFAGAFFYDWRANYELAGGENSSGFSPQNKKAEVVLGEWFSTYPNE